MTWSAVLAVAAPIMVKTELRSIRSAPDPGCARIVLRFDTVANAVRVLTRPDRDPGPLPRSGLAAVQNVWPRGCTSREGSLRMIRALAGAILLAATGLVPVPLARACDNLGACPPAPMINPDGTPWVEPDAEAAVTTGPSRGRRAGQKRGAVDRAAVRRSEQKSEQKKNASGRASRPAQRSARTAEPPPRPAEVVPMPRSRPELTESARQRTAAPPAAQPLGTAPRRATAAQAEPPLRPPAPVPAATLPASRSGPVTAAAGGSGSAALAFDRPAAAPAPAFELQSAAGGARPGGTAGSASPRPTAGATGEGRGPALAAAHAAATGAVAGANPAATPAPVRATAPAGEEHDTTLLRILFIGLGGLLLCATAVRLTLG